MARQNITKLQASLDPQTVDCILFIKKNYEFSQFMFVEAQNETPDTETTREQGNTAIEEAAPLLPTRYRELYSSQWTLTYCSLVDVKIIFFPNAHLCNHTFVWDGCQYPQVIIGSGNDLVSSDDKRLSKAMLT